MNDLKITSSAFEHNSKIPPKYTCDGSTGSPQADINPPLEISGVDQKAESLVIIMDDPDAPVGNWDHWIIFNLDPNLTNIEEGIPPKGISGENSWGRLGYGGPCPGYGEHRYFFKLYTIDIKLNLKQGSTKREIEDAMENHILQTTKIIGLYEKIKTPNY
jgi:Raf kinase inhibitor-like YbhB/YbcL family protein